MHGGGQVNIVDSVDTTGNIWYVDQSGDQICGCRYIFFSMHCISDDHHF